VEVKVFVKEDCPGCAAAMRACEGISNVSVYDLSDIESLSVATSHGVRLTPSVVVVDSSGREIAGWRGEAPDAAALRATLAN
jgi:hypothetical protein